jgi:hypothetical protein
MLLTALVILLIILAFGGFRWGYPAYGYWGYSPLFGLALIILALWVLGVLR